MSIEIKMNRNKILNKALSVVFSEDGANINIFFDLWNSPVGDLQIECTIEIAEYEAYAFAKTSLRELITDAVDCLDDDNDGDRQKMADALRELAASLLNPQSR